MALRDRCCDLSFSLIAGLLRQEGSQRAFGVFVQHPRQQAHRLLPHFPRQLFPARLFRAQLKQRKLGRPARARWDSHQHLLWVTRNRAGLVAWGHHQAASAQRAGTPTRAALRRSRRAPAPCASGSKPPCRTSRAELRHRETRAAVPIRNGRPFARGSLASEKSRRRDQTTGATGKQLLAIRYYGCSIDDLYNTTRMHSSLGYKSPAQFERECHAKSINAANDEQTAILGNTSQPARLQKRAA